RLRPSPPEGVSRVGLRFPRSLRGRLLIATVALVAVGLVVIDGATYAFSRSFLVNRVDQQLRAESSAVDRVLDEYVNGEQPNPFGPGPTGVSVPPGTWGAFLDGSGHIVKAVRFAVPGQQVPAPSLPARLPGSSAASTTSFRYLTSSGGGVRYRVLAAPLVSANTGTAAGTLVVAIPLTD